MERATSQLKASACAQCFLLLFCLFLLLCSSLSGQSNPAKMSVYPPPANSAQTRAMTVDDVIRLSKSGLSDDVIIKQIKKKGQPFDLTTDQLVQLKSASVSERIIQVMIDPTNPQPIPQNVQIPAAPSAPVAPVAPVASAAQQVGTGVVGVCCPQRTTTTALRIAFNEID
jgi:hypothetical protein